MREFTTADRLKELLEVKRISQAGLSKIMGISRSAMCQYISGKITPKQDNYTLSARLTAYHWHGLWAMMCRWMCPYR